MPLLADAVIESILLLENADIALAGHVEAIKARPQDGESAFRRSVTLLTAFLPFIGYEKAQALLKEFQANGKKDLHEFLEQSLGADLVARVLSAENLSSLGFKKDAKNT